VEFELVVLGILATLRQQSILLGNDLLYEIVVMLSLVPLILYGFSGYVSLMERF
jgi:hypothetical protein